MAQTEVAVQRESNFKAILNTREMFGRAQAACGTKEAAKQFMASMLDLYHEGGDYLQKCDANAVIAECFKAAQLNLPLIKSLGYAYIVPFNNVPTFVVGWRGLVQLAQNTGKYRYINADAVYEGEEVTFDRLSGAIRITGQKNGPKAKAIGYFAYIQLLNGFEKTVYMTREEMEAYGRKYSKTYNKGPWQDEFDAMARKTVLRKVLKYGPSSTQMQEAEMSEVHAAETYAQAEVIQNANTGAVVDIPQSAPTKQIEQSAPQQMEEAPAQEPDF